MHEVVLRALAPPADPAAGRTPVPLTSDAHRAAAAAIIGAPAVEWAVWSADRLCRFVLDHVTSLGGGAGAARLLRQSAESRILDILVHLAEGTEPTHATDYAVGVAADFARRGIELQHALGGITLGHQFLDRTLLEIVDEQVPSAERAAVYRSVSDLLFRYHNIQLADVAEAYKAERVRWAASTAAARHATVMSLLAGQEGDLADAGRVLNYDVTGHHLALVAWPRDTHVRSMRSDALQRVIGRLARCLGASPPLVIPEEDTTLWGWIGRPGTFGSDDLRTLRAQRDLPDGVAIAVGDPAHGADGFRISHRTALDARRVALAAPPDGPLIEHGDVALAALLIRDEEAARWFVRTELAALATDDRRTRDIRETVRTYLQAGSSLVEAARELNIARNTVVYRLKQAEELRGRPVLHRVAELHAALEIARTLGVAGPGTS